MFAAELVKRGYTVFAVVHGSQPKFTIPECVDDMNRAVRYIRTHAADWGIDPNRIGMTGASAGGHLSLMLGCAGCQGDPNAKDPVDRASSCVQAVACFFPPTDFLNYGKPGVKSMGIEPDHQFKPPFDFRVQDPMTKLFVPVDLETRETICRELSPCLPRHQGRRPDLDSPRRRRRLVPLQQSEEICEKFKEAGVPCELIVKNGAGHGSGPRCSTTCRLVADWFDKYLTTPQTAQAAEPAATAN